MGAAMIPITSSGKAAPKKFYLYTLQKPLVLISRGQLGQKQHWKMGLPQYFLWTPIWTEIFLKT
jgi:hypothetical protein